MFWGGERKKRYFRKIRGILLEKPKCKGFPALALDPHMEHSSSFYENDQFSSTSGHYTSNLMSAFLWVGEGETAVWVLACLWLESANLPTPKWDCPSLCPDGGASDIAKPVCATSALVLKCHLVVPLRSPVWSLRASFEDNKGRVVSCE